MEMTLKVLLAIPHVFAPKEGSLYSSQTASKKTLKEKALAEATLGNLARHGTDHWIHASRGKGKAVFTRKIKNIDGIDLTIQLYTPPEASLCKILYKHPSLQTINPDLRDFTKVPLLAARRALEQAENYDMVGYIEDDLAIETRDFFHRIQWLIDQCGPKYAFLPHRCEQITGRGDVILSGDPDGGRPDLFWDTGEALNIDWPLGSTRFYRATNPHSGCWFLSQTQALALAHHWTRKDWTSPFQLSGPLEQAASGMLLPLFHIMKPDPAHYRFLMVRHLDHLWERHPLENNSRMEAWS